VTISIEEKQTGNETHMRTRGDNVTETEKAHKEKIEKSTISLSESAVSKTGFRETYSCLCLNEESSLCDISQRFSQERDSLED
jgi:hypothetical protein